MPKYFADTWFWIGLINQRDQAHTDAAHISDAITENDRIFTSQMIFVELLGHFAAFGEHFRVAAKELIDELSNQPSVTIAQQTPEQFANAVQKYNQHRDKQWSLTDCSSMLLMDQNQITTAITNDHHFEQAGFTIVNR